MEDRQCESGRSTATGTPTTPIGTSMPIRSRIRMSGTMAARLSLATHFFSSGTPEVFVRRSFRQPPTLFPIVSISWPIKVKCLVEINLASQQNWIKNLSESIMDSDFSNSGIFESIGENDALRKVSKSSMNKWSTFWPNPKRSHIGKFR